MTIFKRKLRSPFSGCTLRDIAKLRKLAWAASVWEHNTALGEGSQFPYARHVLSNDGCFADMDLMTRFERRATRRLRRRDNWPEIHETLRIEHLRAWDKGAYETAMLRKELAEHRAECNSRTECA